MLMLTPLFISGCATSKGSYCMVANVIRPSVTDTLTLETKRQILAHNETVSALCGVKP